MPRAGEAAEVQSAAAAEPEDLRHGKALNILLVDDHEEVRGTTAAVLQELGHTVTEAANGTKALATLEKAKSNWDLLISDYAMPEISGTELVRKLRETQPGLPCLIITGYAEEDAVGGRDADVMVLAKPFTPAQLSEAILKVL